MIIGDEKCYGCTACEHVCPKNAISLIKNEKGFTYPKVDIEKCINCGICEKKCPLNNSFVCSKLGFYGLKSKKKEDRMNSASGGVFFVVAKQFVENGGAVYGAIYDDNFYVKHDVARNVSFLNKQRGSKYVQSDMVGIIGLIKEDLKSGKKVLFTGTPCQVAGVKMAIPNNDLLYTCDIVCHGVSSPLIFEDYIKFIKLIYGDFEGFSFRNKKISWRGCNVTIIKEGNEISNKKDLDIIKNLYYGHFSTRPSCNSCQFANLNRCSDFTIGDFWGIEKVKPDFDDGAGVSIIILNSPKGKELFEIIKDKFEYFASNVELTRNPQLHNPVSKCDLSDKFWKDYKNKGFKYVAKTYGEYGFVSQLKNKIKKLITKKNR